MKLPQSPNQVAADATQIQNSEVVHTVPPMQKIYFAVSPSMFIVYYSNTQEWKCWRTGLSVVKPADKCFDKRGNIYLPINTNAECGVYGWAFYICDIEQLFKSGEYVAWFEKISGQKIKFPKSPNWG